jgi:flavin reductase (DIM6/NTAB) family NADH-FMN oxidoreductase RutF
MPSAETRRNPDGDGRKQIFYDAATARDFRVLPHLPGTKETFMSAAKRKRSLGSRPLLFPEPALLIATYDGEGKANVMVAAWSGMCCSTPLCLAVSVRPNRWTHDPLLARKAFTVGVASESMLEAVDFAGMESGRNRDKFAAAGWTAVRAEKVDAPYVAECPVILECSLSRSIPLGSHTMMIGAVLDVKADEDCLDAGGAFPDIGKVAPLIYDGGSESYYGVGAFLGRAFSSGMALLKRS